MSSAVMAGFDGAMPEDKEFVTAIARAFAVIEAFDSQHVSMTLSEAAARTGLSPATVRRSLHTLRILGYIRQDGRQFRLGARVLSLSLGYLRSNQIDEILMPELRLLTDSFGDSSSVAILDGDHVLYLASISRMNSVRATASVGARYPAHATSLGKALLAFGGREERERYLASARLVRLTERTITEPDALRAALMQAERLGYATSVDELDDGVTSIAVPVLDAKGRAIAAINSSGYTGRLTASLLVEQRLELLQRCADAIARKLGPVIGLQGSAFGR